MNEIKTRNKLISLIHSETHKSLIIQIMKWYKFNCLRSIDITYLTQGCPNGGPRELTLQCIKFKQIFLDLMCSIVICVLVLNTSDHCRGRYLFQYSGSNI